MELVHVYVSCIVYVPLGIEKVIPFAQVLVAFVIVYDPRHSIVYACVLAVSVVRFVKSILPNTLQTVLVVHVLSAEVEKSTDPILGIS